MNLLYFPAEIMWVNGIEVGGHPHTIIDVDKIAFMEIYFEQGDKVEIQNKLTGQKAIIEAEIMIVDFTVGANVGAKRYRYVFENVIADKNEVESPTFLPRFYEELFKQSKKARSLDEIVLMLQDEQIESYFKVVN